MSIISIQDKRFNKYGKLAPATKADYAFVLHCLYHLNETGTAAIVLPHGVLFRGSAEYTIRKKLIDDNHIHAVIGLPANIFFGTSIPTCILVLKQKRTTKDILFIDASNEFVKGKNQNYLSEQHINKIIEIYSDRKNIDKFAHIATLDEIVANDYNLNISRYVDTFIKEEEIDSIAVLKQLTIYDKDLEKLKNEFHLQRLLIQPVQNEVINTQKLKLRFIQYQDNLQLFKLKDLTNYKNGKSYEHKVNNLGKLELITLNSISIDGNLKSSGKFINEAAETLAANDLIMILSDVAHGYLLGRVAVIPKDKKFVLNQRVAQLRPNINVDSTFLAYYINSHQEYFKLHGTGTLQLNLSKDSVENFPCYIPNLEEQQKIGQFFNIIDQIINTQQFKINNIKTLKQSLLQKMFPRHDSLIPDIRFPEFTDLWTPLKLKDIVTWRKGKGLPKSKLNDSKQGEEVIHYADLYKFTPVINNVLHWSESNEGTVIPPNSLLFPVSDVTPTGLARTSTIIKDNVKAGGDVLIGTLDYSIHSPFLSYQINAQSYKLFCLITGTSVKHINANGLDTVTITSTNTLEQQKIADLFIIFDKVISLQDKKLESLKRLKKAYLQKMFV